MPTRTAVVLSMKYANETIFIALSLERIIWRYTDSCIRARGGGKPETARHDENESRVLGSGNGGGVGGFSIHAELPTLIALPSPPALRVILRTHHPSIQTMFTAGLLSLPLPFPSVLSFLVTPHFHKIPIQSHFERTKSVSDPLAL